MAFKTKMIAASAALAFSFSVSAMGTDYKGISRTLVSEAQVALSQSEAETAQQLFEQALVANPANVVALIGLGKAHEAQDRIPKGLKYYRHALAIEPNNLEAIEAQSLAFLKRELIDEASANYDKLERLCKAGCGALDKVGAAIESYRSATAQLAEEAQ